MDMRPLDAELDDAEVLAPRRGERGFADRLVDAATAQVADRADNPQRDVQGIPRMQKRPLLVRRAGPRAFRWATGPTPLAAALLPQHQLLGIGAPLLPPSHIARLGRHASLIVPDLKSGNRFRRYLLRQLYVIPELL